MTSTKPRGLRLRSGNPDVGMLMAVKQVSRLSISRKRIRYQDRDSIKKNETNTAPRARTLGGVLVSRDTTRALSL